VRWDPSNLELPQQLVTQANDFYNFTMRQNIIVDWTDPVADYERAKTIFIIATVVLNGILILFFIITRILFWRKLC
jgi:hypothetical protein